ncbi:ubinuclein-2a isoform X2 [Erpetoichthys calabaricus]|uniref:ubinuclein-2a isoform X2 n=1 Tax=Erpetoichthys calabaricus TaxID=27687 RepID=UPI00109FC535|nr:ubinuclein-2a isoform X2 [Erpetoichthys calabaricus]
MAEPRKVAFITLSSPDPRKRRREDEPGTPGLPTVGGGGGLFPGAPESKVDTEQTEQRGITLRLNLRLSEPSDKASTEFNYNELVNAVKVKKPSDTVSNPNDPFNDEMRERLEVEALAKKFEAKYATNKKRRDRLQDLIDIGFGYDETDPFIDNSEAYDELVPASLTTKFGGFYINTGTLQFRQASDSEEEDTKDEKKVKSHKKHKEGEERPIKKRKRKDEGSVLEKEKKPRKIKISKQLGVTALNSNRPDKKKRKKLMKDSLSLAAMLRKFTREKEAMRKNNQSSLGTTNTNSFPKHNTPTSSQTTPINNVKPAPSQTTDLCDLATDPTMISILGSANENELLQHAANAMELDLLDVDLEKLLDSSSQASVDGMEGGTNVTQENGLLRTSTTCESGNLNTSKTLPQRQVISVTPPPLPEGLPEPLHKRIGDLRTASRQFDEEGRKKFFTLDMNNILLDIELQLQDQGPQVRAAVYSHLEVFVPCNKEMLMKRLRKLNLNDDRLRMPLQRLKLAVGNVMPEQISRYHEDCLAHSQAKVAKIAKQQSEDDHAKNCSDEDDEEKPGKRVVGPRKKFHWDDRIRSLLCNLVKIKLGCYELEQNKTVTVEDYLKSFMETQVKPLWPKGWMQARMLLKESRIVHSHLTANLSKKKIVPTSKPKLRESSPKDGCLNISTGSVGSQRTPSAVRPSEEDPVASSLSSRQMVPTTSTPFKCNSPPETIYLDSSLDEETPNPSFDSISEALAQLSNAAKCLVSDSPPTTPKPQRNMSSNIQCRDEKLSSITSKLPLGHSHTSVKTHSDSQDSQKKDINTGSGRNFLTGLHTNIISKNGESPMGSSSKQKAVGADVANSGVISANAQTGKTSLVHTVQAASLPRLSSQSSKVPVSSEGTKPHSNFSNVSSISNSPSQVHIHGSSKLQSGIGSVPQSSSHAKQLQMSSSPKLVQSTHSSTVSPLGAQGIKLQPHGSSSINNLSQSKLHPSSTTVSPTVQVGKLHPNSHSSNKHHSHSHSTATPPPSTGKIQLQSSNSRSPHQSKHHSTSSPQQLSHATVKSQTANFITPLQVTISKSPSNPIVKLSNALQATPIARPPSLSSSNVNSTNSTPEKTLQSSFCNTSPSPSTSPSLVGQSRPNSSNSTSPQCLNAYHPKSSSHSVSISSAFRPHFSVSGASKSSQSPAIHTAGASPLQHKSQAFSDGLNSICSIRSHTTANITSQSNTNPTHSSPSSSLSQKCSNSSPAPSQRSTGSTSAGSGSATTLSKPVTARTGVSTSTAMTSSAQLQTSINQVTTGAGLLGSSPPLTLMTPPLSVPNQAATLNPFGMLGGLVPVSLPFQFPLDLLTFPNASNNAAATGVTTTTSVGFPHTLTENLLKGLQTGAQHALPAHLQHAFSDSSQSQGGDVKRKSH